MIRLPIENIIRKNADNPERAAIEVCIYIEERIGGAGNGLFDDDQILSKAIADYRYFKKFWDLPECPTVEGKIKKLGEV